MYTMHTHTHTHTHFHVQILSHSRGTTVGHCCLLIQVLTQTCQGELFPQMHWKLLVALLNAHHIPLVRISSNHPYQEARHWYHDWPHPHTHHPTAWAHSCLSNWYPSKGYQCSSPGPTSVNAATAQAIQLQQYKHKQAKVCVCTRGGGVWTS